MSARALELQSSRRELNTVRDLLGQLEATVLAREQEGFEFVDPLPGASAEAPLASSPGSGGGFCSGVFPAEPGSQLSQAPFAPCLAHAPSGRPGSGGVDLSLTLDLAEDTFPDGSSRSNLASHFSVPD